jgi:hypothetical protein
MSSKSCGCQGCTQQGQQGPERSFQVQSQKTRRDAQVIVDSINKTGNYDSYSCCSGPFQNQGAPGESKQSMYNAKMMAKYGVSAEEAATVTEFHKPVQPYSRQMMMGCGVSKFQDSNYLPLPKYHFKDPMTKLKSGMHYASAHSVKMNPSNISSYAALY